MIRINIDISIPSCNLSIFYVLICILVLFRSINGSTIAQPSFIDVNPSLANQALTALSKDEAISNMYPPNSDVLHYNIESTESYSELSNLQHVSDTYLNATFVPGQIYEMASPPYNLDYMEGITMDVPLSEKLITPAKPIRFLKLFRVFNFKGVGLVFAKSILNLQACGIGIRLPITANFPEYEKLAHLPKIKALVGLTYPLHVRWTVSISLPLQLVLYTLYRVVDRSNQLHLDGDAIFNRLQNPKYTDTTQRVGVTIAIKYNPSSGKFKYTIGSWMNSAPSKQSLEHVVKPYVLIPPAVVIAMLNLIHPIDSNILISQNVTNINADSSTGEGLGNNNIKLSSIPEQIPSNVKLEEAITDRMDLKSNKTGRNRVASSRLVMIAKESKKRKKYRRVKGTRRRTVKYWHDHLLDWAQQKNIALSCSLGYFKTHNSDPLLGSNINIDIGNFRPISSYIISLVKRCKYFLFGPDRDESESP